MNIFIILVHTCTNTFNDVIMASQTSGTNNEMACFDILNVYMRLVNDSPLAKKRSVTANRREAGMVALNLVSCLHILSPTMSSKVSKSVVVSLVKFLKPELSSNFNLSRRDNPNVGPSARTFLVHQRLRLIFFFSLKINTAQAAMPQAATSLVMLSRNKFD